MDTYQRILLIKKLGIGLGIRAPLKTIKKSAMIAENSKKVYYFLIPETHPKTLGVNAFDALQSLTTTVNQLQLGTGIVNVFGRTEKEILDSATKIYHETNNNFILGLGTSTPYIIEKMYKLKFQKPLTRLVNYTIFLKGRYPGKIFWGAVGNKTIKMAAKYADGVLFFLKPENELNNSIAILKSELDSLGKSFEDFEIIVIRPTILEKSKEIAQKSAKICLASYVTGNDFYAKPISSAGYGKEISEVRRVFNEKGLILAAEKISDKMIDEFVTYGGVEDCIKGIKEFSERTKIEFITAAFMDIHPDDTKNIKFLKNLEKLLEKF